MSKVEQGQALASVIEYVTGYLAVDVDYINKDSVGFIHLNTVERTYEKGTISIEALREGIARIRKEFQIVYGIDGLEAL